MVKAMDCEIVISGFELQLRYYVNFRKLETKMVQPQTYNFQPKT